MGTLELNNPAVRQSVLKQRIKAGDTLVASALAVEFDVSPDTIRRDILVLEEEGHVRRVRGGAMPVTPPAAAIFTRLQTHSAAREELAKRAASMVQDGMVLLLDGGSTLVSMAQKLPTMRKSLVVTPAPSVALATLARDIPTVLIGGRLSVYGGVAVGAEAVKAVGRVSADLCFLGACAMDSEFGLGADDYDEAAVKMQICASSARVCVVTTAEKLGRRARHYVAGGDEIDLLITDAPADATDGFCAAGVAVVHVGD